MMLAGIALITGCARTGPMPPLVPMAPERMPSEEELSFEPWRVMVVTSGGEYEDLEKVFAGTLKARLSYSGINAIVSDETGNRVLTRLIERQLHSNEEITVVDPQFAALHADGILTVTITGITVPQRNEVLAWEGDSGMHAIFQTSVEVDGYYTLVRPETGENRTIRFTPRETVRALDRRISISTEELARTALQKAARQRQLLMPLYQEFPLLGYVVGTGSGHLELKVNRGREHGVKKGRRWELLVEERVESRIGQPLRRESVLGTAETEEVHPNYCVVRCDSIKVRTRAKLGMKLRAVGYAFDAQKIWNWTDALPIWNWR